MGESNFIDNYKNWIKKEYTNMEDSKINHIAEGYLDFLNFLLDVEDPDELEKFMEQIRTEPSWKFSIRDETLLDIMLSGENGGVYEEIDKSLIYFNAYRIQKNSIGFRGMNFYLKLDPIGSILPYSREIENLIYILHQNNLIILNVNSAPKIKIANDGVNLLQRNITYYFKRRLFQENIVQKREFEELFNKSIFERETLLESYLLF